MDAFPEAHGERPSVISPEAANKGPIAALRNGDVINIDIPGHRLEVGLAAKS